MSFFIIHNMSVSFFHLTSSVIQYNNGIYLIETFINIFA